MKVEIIKENEFLVFRVEYLEKEWSILERYYSSRPEEYRRGTSNNLFGAGQRADVYFCRHDTSSLCSRIEDRVREMLPDNERVNINITDNINAPPLFCRDNALYLNIAVFRVIPRYDGQKRKYIFEVTLPDDFIYLKGIRFFRYALKALVKELGIYEKGKKVRVIYKLEVIEE
ncbi:MAG: hypothetical protein LM590_15805 [Thermofilum sp.]|nr:hypothetical protein [Thermofilum sp.]